MCLWLPDGLRIVSGGRAWYATKIKTPHHPKMANRALRPMSKSGMAPVAATLKMCVEPKPSATISQVEDDSVQTVLTKIRSVNDRANDCVEKLRAFNQKISESISANAKQQILKLGEQVIEPRIKEQYKIATRLQQQVQHPESNQLSLQKLEERVSAIESKVNTEQVLKLKDDVQKIKEMLLRIVRVKKEGQ